MLLLILFFILVIFIMVLDAYFVHDSNRRSNYLEHYGRNYSALFLGGTNASVFYQKMPAEEKQNLVSAAMVNRNLRVNIPILYRLFSFVKDGGFIILVIDFLDEHKKYHFSFYDKKVLHRIQKKELGIKDWHFEKEMPILYHSAFLIQYLLHEKMKFNNRIGRITSQRESDTRVFDEIVAINNFCMERDRKLKVLFLNPVLECEEFMKLHQFCSIVSSEKEMQNIIKKYI